MHFPTLRLAVYRQNDFSIRGRVIRIVIEEKKSGAHLADSEAMPVEQEKHADIGGVTSIGAHVSPSSAGS